MLDGRRIAQDHRGLGAKRALDRGGAGFWHGQKDQVFFPKDQHGGSVSLFLGRP